MGTLDRRTFLLGAAAVVGVVACSGSKGRSDADSSGDGKQPTTVKWGNDPLQVADLYRPPGVDPVGVVVLIHGGFWRSEFDRTLMESLAHDVVRRGWAAWNLDYRSVGNGGGWPATYLDVADGIDELAHQAAENHLDLDRVAVVGHSAGGTLALWSAARARLPADAPGAKPKVQPGLVVSQAGVNNLVAGVFEQLGEGAVVAMMGGEPETAMADYLLASPVELLPLRVRQVIEYGEDDKVIPLEQSTAYAAKAEKAGDDVKVIAEVRGNHFTMIDPTGSGWKRVAVELARLLDR